MTNWGPIGEEVYRRTYARTKPDGTLETWPETVERVVDGNLALAPAESLMPAERDRLIELMTDMKIIPAGRHLWASGARTSLGLFNCHRAGWGPGLSDHFTFTFDQLMLGGGVGANYSSDYLAALPPITQRVSLGLVLDEDHPDYAECRPYLRDTEFFGLHDYLVVEDSREGWVEALRSVIEVHTGSIPQAIIIDASKVRPRGARIHGFGGTASGPGPLMQMLVDVNDLLNAAAFGLTGTGFLTPLDAMEIDHAIAACVIAGNVRRSARMSILHWADISIFDFIACKADHEHHWSTNISVEVDADFFAALDRGDPHAEKVLHRVAEGMLLNGEPGFYNSTLAAQGEDGDVRSTNPCGEIALEPWEQCCLGHVNLAAYGDTDWVDVGEAFLLMTRFLVRATLAESSDDRQETIKALNRRIGVGFFGFQEWAAELGLRWSETAHSPYVERFLRAMRYIVREAADDYARTLRVHAPIKTTTIAPTGTIAKLPGVTEGIHPIFSRYFIRRVRYSADDPRLAELVASGHPVEDDVYSANTKVVTFYMKDALVEHVGEEMVEQADELTLDEVFAVQAMVQAAYADNAVSFTANVDPKRWTADELADALKRWLPWLKGTTVFPDVSRPQSPYERITADEYEAATQPHEIGQAIDECVGGACPIR